MIFFHSPEEPHGYLSNWYVAPMIVSGHSYSSMEQYMMHQKALTFKDERTAEKIMQTQDVAEIKRFGREVTNYNDVIWNGLRQIIIYKGLLSKFEQNIDLKKKLLSTGNEMLVECAVKDTIWAIGISLKDPRRFHIEQWRGQNLLGFALMEVRKSLQ